MKSMKYIIVGYDERRGIGANGELPWQGELPADMRYFREKTSGSAVIMGRKTLESIGRLLPNRQNIVVTHQDLAMDGLIVAHSLRQAYEAADPTGDIYVIGGGQIYAEALNTVDIVLATEVGVAFDGVDTYFPALGNEWSEVSREHHDPDERNHYPYDFVTYQK